MRGCWLLQICKCFVMVMVWQFAASGCHGCWNDAGSRISMVDAMAAISLTVVELVRVQMQVRKVVLATNGDVDSAIQSVLVKLNGVDGGIHCWHCKEEDDAWMKLYIGSSNRCHFWRSWWLLRQWFCCLHFCNGGDKAAVVVSVYVADGGRHGGWLTTVGVVMVGKQKS